MSYFSHIKQQAEVGANNSSTTNLTSGNSYTFTGTGTSTLGVAALQWNLKTDQNATVYIEQSDDDTNWDISDSFAYYYSKGADGGTVQAITNYWRIRVVLTGTTDTTYFRLNAVLCPIADPLPRALNSYERLKTSGGIVDEETGNRVEVDAIGGLKTVSPVRLIGTAFSGTTKDTNFWTETVTGSGSVTLAGEIVLATGVTADSTAKYVTVRTSRKVPGSVNQFRAIARLMTDPEADNIRRIGPYNANEGFYFQMNGTAFEVGARKGGADTTVASGSFNGNLGASVVMSTTLVRLTIDISEFNVKFFVNNVLLHTLSSATTSLTNTLNLPITMENINSNGNTTDNSFEVRFATIVRLGNITTEAIYKYISTDTTTICKYGAGVLQSINNVENAGTITIYDNTSAAVPLIGAIDASKVLGAFPLNIPFGTGLTIVTAGGAKCIVVYE
ncbi:MAG: hypothetical protein WC495_06375 [Patescibacteria group bacterium]|jgi:hypothetical protein